jgi:hypothetical protein
MSYTLTKQTGKYFEQYLPILRKKGGKNHGDYRYKLAHVEDERAWRADVTEVLQNAGFLVTSFSSVQAAKIF